MRANDIGVKVWGFCGIPHLSFVGSQEAFLTLHMQCVSRGRQEKLAAHMARVKAVCGARGEGGAQVRLKG